jgi:hypothetical protein
MSAFDTWVTWSPVPAFQPKLYSYIDRLNLVLVNVAGFNASLN